MIRDEECARKRSFFGWLCAANPSACHVKEALTCELFIHYVITHLGCCHAAPTASQAKQAASPYDAAAKLAPFDAALRTRTFHNLSGVACVKYAKLAMASALLLLESALALVKPEVGVSVVCTRKRRSMDMTSERIAGASFRDQPSCLCAAVDTSRAKMRSRKPRRCPRFALRPILIFHRAVP